MAEKKRKWHYYNTKMPEPKHQALEKAKGKQMARVEMLEKARKQRTSFYKKLGLPSDHDKKIHEEGEFHSKN